MKKWKWWPSPFHYIWKHRFHSGRNSENRQKRWPWKTWKHKSGQKCHRVKNGDRDHFFHFRPDFVRNDFFTFQMKWNENDELTLEWYLPYNPIQQGAQICATLSHTCTSINRGFLSFLFKLTASVNAPTHFPFSNSFIYGFFVRFPIPRNLFNIIFRSFF